ncbi:hypothetical protein BX666DRAFT_1268551 [Dichotomocladium elegans]|nr:hypothetical protein BX666DRAFT_1268551 [Dichotomocladium elegans]
MQDIIDQVITQLKTLDLNDEDVAAYIAGIVQEDSIPNDEKHGAIVEFLTATTEKDTSSVVDQILKDWEHTQEMVAQAEMRRKTQVIADVQERKRARQQRFMEEKERRKEEESVMGAQRQKSIPKEERAMRNRLLEQYSYDIPSQKVSLGEGNRNAEIIREQDKHRREEMKKQHDAEKERNKMLLENQRQKAEKAKRRTVKKEKQRM